MFSHRKEKKAKNAKISKTYTEDAAEAESW